MRLVISTPHSRSRAVVWRSVIVSKPAKLKREHFALVVEQEQSARVPFEDIAVIVLNHREITLTHSVLSACAEYGIGMYSTGDNHQPNGVFLPFLQHSRATRMQRLQLSIDKPTAKRAWATIVQSKIDNQARCMQLLSLTGSDRLASYARRVRSGDTGNMEAQASAYYFPQVFGCGFHRSQEGWINAALDYGYAVMRGACARALVAHGELRPSDKVALVGLLNVDVAMPRGCMSVLSSIEQAAESLVRLLDGGNEQALELPTLVGLHQHRFEM